MFCTKCGAKTDNDADFCSECGSPVSSFPGGRQGDAPLERRTPQNTPSRKGTEKWLWILLGLLVTAILAVGIILVVAKPWEEKSGNRNETDIERDEEEEETGDEEETGEPDEEEEASSGTADVLRDCLDRELAGQYGYADLGAKTVSFNPQITIPSGADVWTGLSGIADARILDLDGDGQEELLVILLEGENISLCVYEADENAAVKKSEVTIRRTGDTFSHEDVCMLVDGGDASYLLFLQAYWGGVWGDGYYAQAELYQYDGETLYAPLTIKQDGQGSSEFVYIARQYDGKSGEQLSEEVIYDDAGYYGVLLEDDHCRERIKALFGNYGIAIGDQATMQIYGEDFEDFLASGETGEVLMRLEMKAEMGKILRQGNTMSRQDVAFYFNGYRTPFKITGWADDEYGYTFDETKLFFSTDDGRETELILEYPGTVEKVEYMDITGDGIEEAVVFTYLSNTATEYSVIHFIKMESGQVTDVSPWKDIPELSEDWWDMEMAEPSREGYTSPIFKLSSYIKEDGVAYVERELLVGYKDGRWQEVQ